MPNIQELLARAGIEVTSNLSTIGLQLLSGRKITCMDSNGLLHNMVLRNGVVRIEPQESNAPHRCKVRLIGREIMGYSLTDKARERAEVLIWHLPSGDVDLSRFKTAEQAWKVEQYEGWVSAHEEGQLAARAEFESSVWAYTQAEILDAASQGESWPLTLGYVVRVPD